MKTEKNKMTYLLSDVKKYKYFSFKDAQVSFFLTFSVDRNVQNFASLCDSLECFKKNTVHISYG
jgi:hypothetical protein